MSDRRADCHDHSSRLAATTSPRTSRRIRARCQFLAQQIVDDAIERASKYEREFNEVVANTWKMASKQTVDAYAELASQIQVTNQPESAGGSLVGVQEIAAALNEFCNKMQRTNLLDATGQQGFDFDIEAKRLKSELRDRLKRASQNRDRPQTVRML